MPPRCSVIVPERPRPAQTRSDHRSPVSRPPLAPPYRHGLPAAALPRRDLRRHARARARRCLRRHPAAALGPGRGRVRRAGPGVRLRDPRRCGLPRRLGPRRGVRRRCCACCRSGERPTWPTSASSCCDGATPTPAGAARPTSPAAWRGSTSPGLLVDLLNPKTVLFFVAVLPQFVDADAGSVRGQSLLLGGCAVAMALCVDGGYAVLAARAVRRGIPAAAARWGRRASGVAFCGLAALDPARLIENDCRARSVSASVPDDASLTLVWARRPPRPERSTPWRDRSSPGDPHHLRPLGGTP